MSGPFGPYGLPAVVLAYGRPKIGKTTDAIYSFPTALYLAIPGALKAAASVVGVERSKMAVAQPRTLPEATVLIQEAAQLNRFPAVVVDDFSLLAQSTLSQFEQGVGRNGYAAWGKLRDAVIAFRDTARAAGMHVILNAHERGADTVSGRYLPGGPKLPSKSLTEEVPAIADTVLRASVDAMRKPWPGVYLCDPTDAAFLSGDRHNVAPKKGPMNMGEILRAAGYTLPRLPGLEWQDEIVHAGTEAILAGELEKEVLTKLVSHCDGQGHNRLHQRWCLRDILDRVTLRRHQANTLAGFGLDVAPAPVNGAATRSTPAIRPQRS